MSQEAQRWRIGGRVQGVGFRPYVYRLAQSFKLTGWVRNNCGAVEIHAEGDMVILTAFAEELLAGPPPTARARLIDVRTAPLESGEGFLILASSAGYEGQLTIPWDVSICADCVAELRDPTERRYRYPFINCTQCGPRYTIIRSLPYDRSNTSLSGFTLCSDCAAEYSDPMDRRFHAQPLACAACGPALYWNDGQRGDGGPHKQVHGEASLLAAVAALRDGRIVAVRGVGGYHLLCDASSERAVVRLRERKGRPTKPLAVMVPWEGGDGLHRANELAQMSAWEAAALLDSARPIVLLRRRTDANLCDAIAPGLREIAMLLPYSPLHYLLLESFDAAVVATSGNVSGEPVLTLPAEAELRLASIADGFLHHNRPILRPADDAVVRMVAGKVRPLRMGRGTSPAEFEVEIPFMRATLAVGAHGKGSIALGWGRRVVVSPHIGDQSSPSGRVLFAQVVSDLQMLYGVRAECVAHDAHPDFPSTRWARESGLPITPIWHHHAHAAAVAGEYPSDAPLLCFAWDGIGVGPDDTLWGGEALLGRPGHWRRVASFRPFRLPGGERVSREPWRSALALCWDTGVLWPEGETRGGALLRQAFDAGINCPWTTAVGRLFDAAAALTGLCSTSRYEGEAAMRLEAACGRVMPPIALPLKRDAWSTWRSDWGPLVGALCDPRRAPECRAAQFHSSLAHALCHQALAIHNDTGVVRVGLCGGVFQNRILTEQTAALLTDAGFDVLIPQRMPLNDAAISFGQLIEASALHAVKI